MTPTWTAVLDGCVPDDVARILATLPEWFGRPESTAEYVEHARTAETWTVRREGHVVGVMHVTRRYPHVAEIHLIAVDREQRGRGVGQALVDALVRDGLERGVRLLVVKTLGASDPDPAYAQTRRFYERSGFLAVEETAEWGEDTPCLVMVRPLPAGAMEEREGS